MTQEEYLTDPNRGRHYFLYLSIAYVIFITYGSLVPLHYKEIPFSQALDAFIAKSVTDVSPADWVANILLGVPMAYFFSGFLWRSRAFVFSVFIALMIFVSCYCISWSIEFSQMFFSSRTPSKSDITAQNIGAVIGLVAWWLSGRSVLNWIQHWQHVRDTPNLSEQLLKAYIVILLFYNLLPLDLTISPVEIYHKWQEGRVMILPFISSYEGPMELLYELVTDALIWVPVAILLVTSGKRSSFQAWLVTLYCVLGLELLQLFVYSRVTDSTDIITGAIGATIGVLIGERIIGSDDADYDDYEQQGNLKPFIWGTIMFMLWCAALFAIFWYPYELIREKALLIEKAKHIEWIPFRAYYRGSEFRAVTEVFHKIGFFIPLGVILAYPLFTLRDSYWYRAAFWVGILLIAGVAGMVEAGQLFFIRKYPDITDFGLETLGGVLGLTLAINFRNRLVNPVDRYH